MKPSMIRSFCIQLDTDCFPGCELPPVSTEHGFRSLYRISSIGPAAATILAPTGTIIPCHVSHQRIMVHGCWGYGPKVLSGMGGSRLPPAPDFAHKKHHHQ